MYGACNLFSIIDVPSSQPRAASGHHTLVFEKIETRSDIIAKVITYRYFLNVIVTQSPEGVSLGSPTNVTFSATSNTKRVLES